MSNKAAVRKLFVGLVACSLLIGCQTTRYEDSASLRDMPEWVAANAKLDHKDQMVYFVGCSQEKALSESEAVNEAYMDALFKAADAVGLRLAGWQNHEGDGASDAGTRFPHPIWRIRGKKYRDQSKSAQGHGYANALSRDQVISMTTVADTWVVRERWNNRYGPDTNPPNQMASANAWKAKVLLSISKKDLQMHAKQASETRAKEVELKLRQAELAIQQFEGQGKMDARQAEELTKLMLGYVKAQSELRLANAKKRAELQQQATLTQFDLLAKPTFHFMTNAVWHGYSPAVLERLLHVQELAQPEPRPYDLPLVESSLPTVGGLPTIKQSGGTHFTNFAPGDLPVLQD